MAEESAAAVTAAVAVTAAESTKMTSVQLTDRMKQRTKQPHDKSDRMVNLRLAIVITNRELWAEALSLFAFIYMEMEEILERNKTKEPYKTLYPLLANFERSKMFQADIDFFMENEKDRNDLWQRRKDSNGKFHPPELDRYIQRMRELEQKNSPAIISYFYHMNMALMAGGFFIKKAVKRAFNLKTDHGVRAFTYDCLENVKKTRDELKRLINSIPLAEDEIESVLQESVRVFEQNNALVATVQDSPWYAVAANNCLSFTVKWGAALFVLVSGVILASRYGLSRQPSKQ